MFKIHIMLIGNYISHFINSPLRAPKANNVKIGMQSMTKHRSPRTTMHIIEGLRAGNVVVARRPLFTMDRKCRRAWQRIIRAQHSLHNNAVPRAKMLRITARITRALLCVESNERRNDDLLKAIPKLNPTLPKLPHEVHLETFTHTINKAIGALRFQIHILKHFNLEQTGVAGNSRAALTLGRGVAVGDRLFEQCDPRRVARCLLNQGLAPVVVALHLIELWQMLGMVRQVYGKIPSNSPNNVPRNKQFDIQLEHFVCEHHALPGLGTEIAGFINKYEEAIHDPHAPYNKKAGETSPALGGLSEKRTTLFIPRAGSSIQSYQTSNTCSPL